MLWEHEVVGSNPIVPTTFLKPMHFKNVVLDSMAYVLADEVWTSAMIEDALSPLYQRLRLPYGRLAEMTGIQERRHWSSNTLPSEAAVEAGTKLLSENAIDPSTIDTLIHASVCRNRLEPATAAYVHQGLKLSEKTQIFDLSNACLGVLNAIIVGASMIEAGTARSVLIVSGENGRSLLDNTINTLNQDTTLTRKTLKPYFANLTIGSGAVALLLRSAKEVTSPKPLILGGIVRTDSSANTLCEGNSSASGLAMQTQATALLEAGIRLSTNAWKDFKNELGWSETTPQHVITHQVGYQHQKKIYDALHLDIAKDFSTFQKFGNTGSVALPLSLCRAQEAHRIHNCENVLLLGIGSGLSTAMLGLLWQE